MFLLFASCTSISGVYYSNNINGEYVNTVLVLRQDKTYHYVGITIPLGFTHRIYNDGTYKKKGNKIILNSYNKLKNDSFYFVKEYIDKELVDSVKFIIVDKSLDKGIDRGLNNSIRIFINNKYQVGRFKRSSNSQIFKDSFKLPVKFWDIEFSGIAYKRYYTNNRSNVFEITFNKHDKLDSLKNIFGSYFENEEMTIKKNKLEWFNGFLLVKDKCKVCDTSIIFKKNFLLE
jgi:hypothetical protein